MAKVNPIAIGEAGIAAKKTKKKPPLGSGARFAALKSELAAKGAQDPGALAAYIGRKKYGKKRFAKLSAKGRK